MAEPPVLLSQLQGYGLGEIGGFAHQVADVPAGRGVDSGILDRLQAGRKRSPIECRDQVQAGARTHEGQHELAALQRELPNAYQPLGHKERLLADIALQGNHLPRLVGAPRREPSEAVQGILRQRRQKR